MVRFKPRGWEEKELWDGELLGVTTLNGCMPGGSKPANKEGGVMRPMRRHLTVTA